MTPRFQSVSIDGSNMDITAPEYGVEVEVREDGKVLWVSVDGITVLRICQIPYMEVRHPGGYLHCYRYGSLKELQDKVLKGDEHGESDLRGDDGAAAPGA